MPSITDSIGRVLGDRYRLVTALGTGASAHVYLADDVSLNRRVAIKVLHPALAGDTSFLKRFRAEAQAVAALSHPNILRVYDWGEEGGVPYLVLEFLAGGSLREVYDTGVLLSPAQAVQIGIEAAAGLDYAHRRGFVHRDIKPANLLFDADRRLRIADFGLARALAEASWTEPEGAMLGTARYSAPEQVEGFVLDGKADVYALALVLYEGVTGEAPFIGDTVPATLMARVGVLLPEHDALGPLNDVLVWAAAPEPAERYDASQLAVRLETLARSLPRPEPLPLAEGATAGDVDEAAATRNGATRVRTGGLDGLDRTELGASGAAAEPRKGTRHLPTAKGKVGTAGRRRRRWPWITAAAVIVAALIAGAVVVAARSGVFTPSHPVPALVGKSLAQADRAVQVDHFTVHPTAHAYNLHLGTGLILSQHPAPGSKHKPVTAKQGSAIDVVVSLGPPPVKIPDLYQIPTCNQAIQVLKSEGLVGACPPTAAQYSPVVSAGAVIATSPSKRAVYGSTVTIIISKGHAPVTVPVVTGSSSTYATASASLAALGFVPSESRQYSSTVSAGQVIGTVPAASAGPQPFGSPVTVDVSIGPQPVKIPDVVGHSVTTAADDLESIGLHVAGPYGPPHASTVISTDPAPGTFVQPGTTVDLYTR